MRVVVVTVVHGRHEHLRRQLDGLAGSTRRPDEHVIVAIDDPDVGAVAADSGIPTRICVPPSVAEGGFPRARARNVGAQAAIADGCDVLVFLDVDCIPAPRLVERYAAAAATLPRALLSGPVAYLDPPAPGGYDLSGLAGRPGHPARPVPAEDALVGGADHRLFWSLSFALTPSVWQELGGFCTDYTGYGAEDTDFGQLAAAGGIGHAWVGGAWAYHQWHPVQDPPAEHAADIVRNANLFHDRWGWWPMADWLDAFAERGLAHLRGGRWQCRPALRTG